IIDLLRPWEEPPMDPEILVRLDLLMQDLGPFDPTLGRAALEVLMAERSVRMTIILPPEGTDPGPDFKSPLLEDFSMDELMQASSVRFGARRTMWKDTLDGPMAGAAPFGDG